MSIKNFMICLVLLIPSVAFMLLGFWYRQMILDKNTCSMTYSFKSKERLKTLSISDGSTLWRYDTGFEKSKLSLKSLKMYPVLFLHGHMGEEHQVRSMASYMHNEGKNLEYFSLQFNDSNMAFHASDVLNKAVSVNNALTNILEIYKKGNKAPPKIIIAAHSFGGIAARTAVLLNNFPEDCPVSDIIMFSSPNSRPPYSIDASMESLFFQVNKVWQQSLFFKSPTCRKPPPPAAAQPQHVKDKLTINLDCSKCSPKIRLASFTGGILDNMVNPSLTRLDHIAPLPRNSSALALAEDRNRKTTLSYIVSMYSTVLKLPMQLAKTSSKYLVNLLYPTKTTKPINPSNKTMENNNETKVVDDISLNEINKINNSKNSNKSELINSTLENPKPLNPYAAITPGDWKKHMQSYIDPSYTSIRSSQLMQVGVPIDHRAILWCSQFIEVVVNGLEKLATIDNTNMPTVTSWEEIFPTNKIIKNEKIENKIEENKISNLDDLISPVKEFIIRNNSYTAWNDQEKVERMFVLNAYRGHVTLTALLGTMAYEYISFGLYKIITCFVIISTLIYVSPYIRQLSGYSVTPQPMHVTSNPYYHLHIDILIHASIHWIPFIKIKNNYAIHILILLVMFSSKVIIDFYYLLPLNAFLITYGSTLSWVTAYCTALVLRTVCYYILLLWSNIIEITTRNITAALVFLFWSRKPFRKIFKKYLKYLNIHNSTSLMIKYICVLTCTVLLLATVGYWVSYTTHIVLPTSVCTLYTVLLAVSATHAFITWLYIWIPSTTPNPTLKTYLLDLALLYLPITPLVLPSALVSLQLLITDRRAYTVAAYMHYMFYAEIFNYIVVLAAISYHLLSVHKHGFSFITRIPSIPILSEAFGPSITKLVDIDSPAPAPAARRPPSPAAPATPSDGKCRHEDGGRFAIFEKSVEQSLVVRKSGILIGCTYIVSSCSCAKDPLLKDYKEYCEYCLCRKCGGKDLPTVFNRYSTSNGTSTGEGGWEVGLLDLVQAVVVYAIAVGAVVYAQDRMHRLLYLLGGVAGVFIARDLCSNSYFMRTMIGS